METPGLADGCFRMLSWDCSATWASKLPTWVVLEAPDKQSWTFSKTEDSRKLSKIKTKREQEQSVSRCFKTCLKMFEAKYDQIFNMYMLRSVVHVLWVFQMPFLHLAVKTCQLNVAWLEKCPAWLIRSWINLNRQGREEHRGASKAGDLEPISNHSDIFGQDGQDCSIHFGPFRI